MLFNIIKRGEGMKTIFKWLGYILLGFIAISIWSFWKMDGFKSIENRRLANCSTISGNGSAEDIQIDYEHGLAYISVADRMAKSAGRPIVNGAIAVYDLNNPQTSYETPSFTVPAEFRPHGLSLYIGKDGVRRLFVINHLLNGEHAVEIFSVSQKQLQHLETIKHPLMVSPNDLVAVGPRQFYVGNDSGATKRWQKGMEMMGILALSTLTYFDGADMKIVATDFPSAGGINVSNDGQWIFASGTSSKTLEVFSRDPASGNLQEAASISLHMSPDNIDVAADGSVWVTGHPKAVALIQHFISRGEKTAPSMVEHLVWNGKNAAPTIIHESDGTDLPASSVAAVFNNRLLMGGITPLKLLDCPLP
jgi:arylesterase/paraoxonase